MTNIYVGTLFSEDYLAHHGILGMKWGIRRYQNEDGTLTPAGRKRKLINEHKNEAEKKSGSLNKVKSSRSSGQKLREYAVRGAKVAGVALAAYGAYKVAKAYKKWSNSPYYDSIGNYVNPKMSGSRSVKDLVRTAYTKAAGKSHYDAIGNYVEGRKSENARYKERSRNHDALGNYYNKKYWNEQYKKRAAEMANNSRTDDGLIRVVRSSDPDRARRAKKVQDVISRATDAVIKSKF